MINTPDYKGNTLLFYAIQKNSYEMVEALINSGAKVNQEHKEHTSLIAYAVQNASYEIVELMINRGAKLDQKIKGDTLLHFAMLRKDSSGIFERTKERSIARILIEKGIENINTETVNLKVDMGHELGILTPLMYAIDKNNTPLAIKLIGKLDKDQINETDGSKTFTALSYAKRRENDEVEKALRNKAACEVAEKEADTFLGSVKSWAFKPAKKIISHKYVSVAAKHLRYLVGDKCLLGDIFGAIDLFSAELRGDVTDYEREKYYKNLYDRNSAGAGASSGQAAANQGDADNTYGAIKPYNKSEKNVKILQQTLMRIGYWVNNNTVPQASLR